MVISDYYKSLEEKDKKEFRERVLEELGISLPTFYYKVRKGNWNKLEQKTVEAIINNVAYA